MTLNPEIIIMDTDFRGEQYFLRLYYSFPNQNTSNNMKEIKKEILECIRIKNNLEEQIGKTKDYLKEARGFNINQGTVNAQLVLEILEKVANDTSSKEESKI